MMIEYLKGNTRIDHKANRLISYLKQLLFWSPF